MSASAADWGMRRRAAVWANLGVQILLLAALLIVVNLLAQRFRRRFDLTSQRTYEISRFSEDAIRRLDYDLEIWLTSMEYAFVEDKSVRVAWQRTAELIGEFQKRTDRIRFNVVSIQDSKAVTRLQAHWPKLNPNTIYFMATLGPDKVNQATIDLYDVFHGNSVTGEIDRYNGEAVLVQAIRELSASVKKVVYETTGHQEMLTVDTRTMSMLHQILATHEGIEFRPFGSLSGPAVPEDADALMILGPLQTISPAEVAMFRDYLARGGKMFVALRPGIKTGLEEFLAECGVGVGTGVMLDPKDFYPPAWNNLIVRRFGEHKINRGMENQELVMPNSVAVTPLDKGEGGWKAVTLAVSGDQSWEETGELGPDVQPRRNRDERAGSLSLIAAAEKPGAKPEDRTARLLVWGSAEALTNSAISPTAFVQEVQVYYVISNFRWLLEGKVPDIAPKAVSVKPLDMSPESLNRLTWVSLLGFPMMGVLLGLIAWFLRRK